MPDWGLCDTMGVLQGLFQHRTEFPMGKYIKGKKLPKGIPRRKDDGKFMAGFVDKAGKRHQRRFDTMVEAGR